jgi:hypothetical protein
MKNTILLKDLSENKIDKVIANDSLQAAGWEIHFSWNESWFFTILSDGVSDDPATGDF